MKNTKRVISVVLAVLMLISAFPLASSAITPGGTVNVTGTNNYISGFYYRFNGNFDTGKYGQHQWLKADGQPAYCVEPGKSLTAGQKNVVEAYQSLSDEQQKQIKCAFIYGYNGITRYGYDSATEYVATQAIIWAIALGAFNNPGNENILLDCAFGGSTSAANKANGINVYNMIKAQILSHETIPSFATKYMQSASVKNITLNYNAATGQYEGRITDTNGVLGNYTFSQSGVTFVKDGNDLCIFTAQELDGSVVSGRRTSNTYTNSLPALVAVYCVGADQTTATAMNRDDPVEAYFSITTAGRGIIEVQKHSEEGDAIGTVFNISGNGVNMDVSIDTLYNSFNACDGYVRIGDLVPGTYTVTEKGVSDKYYVTPAETQTVTVVPNTTSTVSFSNNIRRGNIQIIKVSEDGKNEGYQFSITGTGINGESVYEVITTDAEGKAIKTGLPIGRYIVTELNCPSYMVTPYSQAFKVNYNETKTITFKNNYKRGDLVLSKIDADTGDVILSDDAVFEVSEYNKNTGAYDYVCNLEHSSTLNEATYGCTDGYYATSLPITESNEGKYRVTEKTAPSGYVTDGKSYDVIITDNKEVVKINDGTVVNKMQKAHIELVKTDKETGKAVANAIYDIYAKNDIIANGVLIASANTKVDTVMTDAKGKATSGILYLGDYYIKEAEAPNGYVLDKNAYDVSLTYDGEKSEVFVQTSRVSDMPQKATIEIVKKDAETDKTIINSAKYGVYANEDIFVNGDLKYAKDELVTTITTANGSGKSEPLYLGAYYVRELEAPNGYNKNANTMYVPLMYQGQNVSVFNFSITDTDYSQKGKIIVTKADAETNDTIETLTAEFEVYARHDIVVNGDTIYNAGMFIATIKTTDGVATTDWLPLGDYYIKEKTAPVGYTINTDEYDVSLVYDSNKESVSAETTVADVPQKAVITVSKVDKETNIPIEGAVYIIKTKTDIKINGDLKYRAGQVVDEVTTNAHGQGDTVPLYIGEYTVTEKSAPKPYVRDKNVYDVNIAPVTQDIAVQSFIYQVTNLSQKGVIKITKTDSETGAPLANAVYKVIAADEISINGVVVYRKNDVVCEEITTDNNGVATSPELYLGKYYVVEKTAPSGYVLNTDEIFAELEYQGQEVEVFEKGYTAENAPQKGNIEISKTDAETGLPLAYAEYEIYSAEDIILNGDLKYSANTLVDTVTTDESGKTTSKYLYLGKYYVVEKTAPSGYVLNTDRKDVTLSYKGQNVSFFTETVDFANVAQKGIISISKYGEVLNNIINDKDVYTPEYAVKPLKNAVYDIIAVEDIVTADGAKRASAGEIVGTVTTGENGIGESKELYLGTYKVIEKVAPYGMVNNTVAQEVTLKYEGQSVELTTGATSFVNERQKATIEVEKLLERDDLYNIGNDDEITNVKFGLYADEAITAYNGTSIPKDGLIEIATSDKNGHIEFNSDIPLGKYYVKEVSTDKHYIPSETKYPVEFAYAGQAVLAVRIDANDGNAISNDIIRGTITGYKVDDDDNAVVGATMGLFSTETTEFTKDNAYAVSITDEGGVFTFENVPYGDYVVREIEAPEGFVLSEKSTPVSVTENAQVIEIKVLDSIITGNLLIDKVDKEFKDKKLTGAVFEIYVDVNANGKFDEDIDTLYDTVTSDTEGEYLCEGLRYNGYFLHEKTAPEGFITDDEYYYFEIRNNGETVIVSNNEDGKTFENEPIIGTLEITKRDIATGNLIPNAGFRIYDVDGNIVAEGYTDENGIATFKLRYGKYKYQEFDAAPGYILDETPYEFEIKENGEIVKANMTNEAIPVVEIPKTGDSARNVLGGLTGLSILSVLGIYFTRKKKDNEE